MRADARKPASPAQVAVILADEGLGLRNADGSLPAPPGEHFTTWKFRVSSHGGESEKRAVIDYIFHSPALRPVARWAHPTTQSIGPDGLPCALYPSDHLAIAVTFEW